MPAVRHDSVMPWSSGSWPDTIDVELHNVASPHGLAVALKAIVQTDGTSVVIFPNSVFNQSYYIVIKHRNSVETWSKNPMLFDAFTKNFDFTKE